MKQYIDVLKQTVTEWQQDKASRLAAALAFYAILAIPPLLVLISALVGQFAGADTAQQAIVDQVGQVLGAQGTQAIATILDAAAQPINLSLTAVVSVAVLFFSASGVFVQLQDALNTVWNVMPDPDAGLKNTIRKRLVSFAVILAVAVLFLLLLAISSAVAFLGDVLNQFLPGTLPTIRILNGAVGFGLLVAVFALIYKTLPDAQIQWRDVGMGAVVTAVLFALGIVLIGFYLQYSDPTSSYGAAGSLIVLLIWVYYSAQIFFFGAEFTQVYANHLGGQLTPEEGAVRVEKVTRPVSREEAGRPQRETG